MPSTASQAGPAAPSPAAVALPSYTVDNRTRQRTVLVRADAGEDGEGPMVTLRHDSPALFRMTPAAARQLAVYLVDCANALDDPAKRVIVDDTAAWPLKPCQDMGAPRARPEGEGIGHE